MYPPVLLIPILHFHFYNGIPAIECDPGLRAVKARYVKAKVVDINEIGVWVSGPLVPGDRLGT